MYTDAKLVLSQQTTAASNGPTDTRAKRHGNQHLFPESSSAPTNGNPSRHTSNLLTHYTFTTNTTCCILCWTSPSSSAFHTGTWTFSILPNIRASWCEQVLLFKLPTPLDPFIQINPTQSHSCLSPPAVYFYPCRWGYLCDSCQLLTDSPCSSWPRSEPQALLF